eukprot:TRINITY_DN80354_c0_g1_i1.p1 TRINITY_DN80354_c0_g1~~TRINITY_DN80354_c0_g1_i1.p1  ORF type:complete len:511 (+),score=117.09 TRINITY_DN80354_c0_g1_i1:47-1579(+)
MGAGGSTQTVSSALASASDADVAAAIAEMPKEVFDKLKLAFKSMLVQKTPSAAEVLRSTHSGEKQCVSIMKEVFARINAVNGDVNACVEVLEKTALESAAEVDKKVASGTKLRPLEGLPLLVKANVDLAGTVSTNSTPAFKAWRPSITAPCVQKLLDAGAIPIAKTNMPEFALRCDGWNYLHGMCCNPHSLKHSPGGSSSGTAAAIACGITPVGVGTDTSGSLRIPAACCGIVGFRPSIGRWPGAGVVPIDSRKDTAGPMGQCVADVALLDATVTGEVPVEQADNLSGVQVSIPRDWIESFKDKGGFDDTFLQALEQAKAALEKAGAAVVEKPDFFKIVEMRPAMSAIDSAQDMDNYLSLHADRSEEVSRAKIIELSKNEMASKMLFGDPLDMDAHKTKVAEADASILKTNAAYREYFKEHALQAILMPTMTKEPMLQNQEEPPPLMEMMAVGGVTARLTEVKIPSISIPTTVKHKLGGGSLPASVLLLGVDDRQLLSIALSLEKAILEM